MRTQALVAAIALLAIPGAADAQPQGHTTTFRMEPIEGLAVDKALPGFLDVLPGASRTHEIRLRNGGNETLDLGVSAAEAAPSMEAAGLLVAEAVPRVVVLAPGEEANVTVSVTAAAEAANGTRSAVNLQLSRNGTHQMRFVDLPILVGPPCDDCRPDPPSGVTYFRSPGAEPGGEIVVAAPPSGSNATAEAAPAADTADPYREVPAAPPLLAAAIAAGIAALRRARRLALPLALAAVVVPWPGASAAPADTKAFHVTRVTREDHDLVLGVSTAHVHVPRATLALVSSDGTLLAPEQEVRLWSTDQERTFRFADVAATTATLRIHYHHDGREHAESFGLAFPPPPSSGLEVTQLERVTATSLDLTLANLGDDELGAILAKLEDAAGARVGEPAARRIDGLAPGSNATLRFTIPANATSVVLALDVAGKTTRTALRVPALVPDPIELALTALDERGAASFVVTTSGARTLHDVRAWLTLPDGTRVGQPALRTIGLLAPHEAAELTFRLPEATTDVVLHVATERSETTFPVRLARLADGPSGALGLATDLPAREAAPGGAARYTIAVENRDAADATVTLRTEGLPQGFEADFAVGTSAARTLVVPAGTKREVHLDVRVPESASRHAGADLPLRVVASAEGRADASLDLRLGIRGAGKLDLQGRNWLTTQRPGDEWSVPLALRNIGSAALLDVAPSASAPPGWLVTFEPSTLPSLEAGALAEVTMRVRAPSELGSGRYNVDVGAAAGDVVARPRSFVVEIEAETPSRLPWVAAAGTAGLAAVALIVKLRRR